MHLVTMFNILFILINDENPLILNTLFNNEGIL